MPTSTARRKKALRKECFRLLHLVSLKREPNCAICSRPGADDPHHFIPKSVCKHLQLDLDNIVSVHRGCHSRLTWTRDPELNAKIESHRPKGWAEKLYEKRRQVVPSMWTISYLEDKKREFEALLTK